MGSLENGKAYFAKLLKSIFERPHSYIYAHILPRKKGRFLELCLTFRALLEPSEASLMYSETVYVVQSQCSR